MNMNLAEAYNTVNTETMSGRNLEAEVLSKAALKLQKCRDNWEDMDRNKNLDAALKFDQLLWCIFQAELAEKTNPLPEQLKIDLLKLSKFIDGRIFDIMAYPAKEKLTILIDINNNIADGLRLEP